MLDSDEMFEDVFDQFVVVWVAPGDLNVDFEVGFDDDGALEELSVFLFFKGEVVEVGTDHEEVFVQTADQSDRLEFINQIIVFLVDFVFFVAVHLWQEKNPFQAHTPIFQNFLWF